MVADQGAGICPQQSVGIDHRVGKPSVKLCFGFAGIELAQHHLAVRPRQIEHAVSEAAVTVFFHQLQAGFTGISNADDHIECHRCFGFEGDAVADGNDGVKRCADAVGQVISGSHGVRRNQRIAAPNELRPVGFIRNAAGIAFMHCHQMEQPRAVFIEGAGAAGTQDGLQRVDDFGLHKQLAEGGVQGVGGDANTTSA